jgi:hypothetical protein
LPLPAAAHEALESPAAPVAPTVLALWATAAVAGFTAGVFAQVAQLPPRLARRAGVAAPTLPPVGLAPPLAVVRKGPPVAALTPVLAAPCVATIAREHPAATVAMSTLVAAAPVPPMADGGGVALPMSVLAALDIAMLPAVVATPLVTVRQQVPVAPAIVVAGPPVTVEQAARVQIEITAAVRIVVVAVGPMASVVRGVGAARGSNGQPHGKDEKGDVSAHSGAPVQSAGRHRCDAAARGLLALHSEPRRPELNDA